MMLSSAVNALCCGPSEVGFDCTVQADKNMGKFLDYCTYGHMIDNVILIVTGTLHERDVQVGRWSTAYSIGSRYSRRFAVSMSCGRHEGVVQK
jgi:ATP synthase (C/AC39) subunit